jgi:T-complex protein 1 subunit alpha
LLNAGANVILTTGGIDDLCLKQFIEAGAMAVRRCKKADLKRIAKATGGKSMIEFHFISTSIIFSNIINCFG